MTRFEWLKTNPVFRDAPTKLFEQLLDASTAQRYSRGQIILSEGEVADRIFALEKGAVRVFHRANSGLEVVVKMFRAPALFGEAEALVGAPYVEHVSAIEHSDVLVMPVDAVMKLLREHAPSACAMVRDLAMRLTIASQNEKALAFFPVTVRLANYLLDYATWTNDPGATDLRIDLTQDDMAAAVGATRRSVTKDMAVWQKEGILEKTESHYILRNRAALARYADPQHLPLTYSLTEEEDQEAEEKK